MALDSRRQSFEGYPTTLTHFLQGTRW